MTNAEAAAVSPLQPQHQLPSNQPVFSRIQNLPPNSHYNPPRTSVAKPLISKPKPTIVHANRPQPVSNAQWSPTYSTHGKQTEERRVMLVVECVDN